MEDFQGFKDFGALADAAAAERLSSQRVSTTPLDSATTTNHAPVQTASATQPMSQSQTPSSAQDQDQDHDQDEDEDEDGDEADTQPPAPIGSDITAWQTAIQTLPAEFKNTPRFQHLLASMLSDQKTIRHIEWNPYRQNGGFVPRTPNDFSSMMIFICGQINPNPCRNCRLRNGPYAKCIVAPPEILAISTIRHACANCCYQNQHRRCTNEPITQDELIRSQVGRAGGVRNGAPKVRRPKSHIPKTKPPSASAPIPYGSQLSNPYQTPHTPYTGNATQTPNSSLPLPALGKPSSESGSVKSFADKVRMARAWNQQSRRRMKAELLQWQAALATVDAERPRKTKPPSFQSPAQTQTQTHQSLTRPPPGPSNYNNQATIPSSSYPQYAPPLPNGRAPLFQLSSNVSMGGQEDASDVSDSEDEEEGGGGDHTWTGFDDEEDARMMIKPPIP